MKTTETEEQLWNAVLDNPGDPIHLRILADYYEEFGSAHYAEGLRWAADHNHHPWVYMNFVGSGKNRYCWYDEKITEIHYDNPEEHEEEPNPEDDLCGDLPPNIFKEIPDGDVDYLHQMTGRKVFLLPRKAWSAFLIGFETMRLKGKSP